IAPNTSANVFVLNTTSRDNAGSGIYGAGNGSNVRVTIKNSAFEGNVVGVFASDSTIFTVKDSDASGNGWVGYCAVANGSGAELDITDSMVSNNSSYGVQYGGGGSAAVVRLSGVAIVGNGAGGGILLQSNGSVVSFGNNQNTGTGAPTSIGHLQ